MVTKRAAMESELDRIVDALPGLVWTAFPDGHIDYLNQRWCEYTGLGVEESRGRGWQAAVHPADLPRLLAGWRPASSAAVETQVRLRGPDGKYRWFLFRAHPSTDAFGEVVKWCGLSTDIDEQMRAEEALRASERRFRLIVDDLPILLSTATPDGKLDQANRHYLEYFGATLEELKAYEAVHSLHPDDRARVLPVCKAAIEAGIPYEVECRRRRADGVYRWFYLRAFPLRDAQGRVALWYRLGIDIEEKKKAEALLAGEKRLLEMVASSRPLRDGLESLCRLVESTANGSYCSIVLVNPSGTKFEEAIAPSLATEFIDAVRGWSLHRRGGPCQIAARDKIQVIMSDVASDTRWRNGWRALAQAHGLSSCWSTPIVSLAGKVLGTFALYQREPGSPNPPQLELIERFTHIASIAIERAQRDAALRESEARRAEAERELQLTIDSIPTLVGTYRPDGSRIFVNQTWRDYSGLSLETASEAEGIGFIHPDDAARVNPEWQKSLATGVPFQAEIRLRRVDGEYRWHLNHRVAARDASGAIVKWYSVGADIEERKRAEQKAVEAERELQRTIDHIPVLVATYRANGSRLYINKRVREYTDRTAAEDWQRTMHPDDIDFAENKWRACVATGEQFELEFRVRMADGTYRWHQNRRVPLRDEAGKIMRWYGIGYDIEDRKRAEQELRRSEAFLAKAQRLSSTGSFSFYSATGEFAWSEELYRIFEFELGVCVSLELIGSRYHPDDRHVMEEVVEGIRLGTTDFDYEHRLLMPDRSIKHIHVVAHGSPDREGGGLEYFGAVQDITQRRVAEAALDKARSELAHVTRVMSLGALTASIAHEISQPLAGIITNASTCVRMLAADPPKVKGALETARRTIRDGNRAADVITRLRALFSKRPAATETVDLNEATREVLALVSSDLLRRKVFLRAEIHRDHPVLVAGDRVQLQQVILNLVRNASDAMTEITDRLRHLLVKVESAEGGGARLIVKDAGVGLDPQTVGRLFDAFYTTKSDGMGIGLSISRSIIESHGGKLWAEATDGPGAMFICSLPPLADSAGDGAETPKISDTREAMRSS
jgi:PAS domain S-box-containing protein